MPCLQKALTLPRAGYCPDWLAVHYAPIDGGRGATDT